MDRQLLRVGEAAQALNVSRWTIYRWVEEGRLEAARIGKSSLRIFRHSIASLIERGRTDALESVPRLKSVRAPGVARPAKRR
ncbi:MAG: helix-turn-helix domain-containing protein [Nitrospira sp.]|nr:helix-turn-helix domain-containing protein [Nitrospira sp.]